VPAVVDAEAIGVEGLVVDALDLRMNVGLLVVFDPFGKGIFDFAQSGARSDRSYRVDDGLAIRIVFVERRFLEVKSIFEELVARHPSARPLVSQLECVVAGRQIDAPAAIDVSGNGRRAVAGCWALLGQMPVEETRRTPRWEPMSVQGARRCR
jgi:hypothetical protein